MTPGVLLELQNVSFGISRDELFAENLNLQVRLGDLVMITGPNGSGKSTLLSVLAGQAALMRGRRKFAAREMEWVPQAENLEFHLPLNLRDVIVLAERTPDVGGATKRLGLLKPSQLLRAWNSASGGERKRTLLTRALLGTPDLLLLDEPFNHLDKASTERVAEELRRRLEAKQCAVVMISHTDGLVAAKLATYSQLQRVQLGELA